MKKTVLFLTFISLFFALSESLMAKTILFLGDSLTEGYGIERKDSYPSKVKELIEKSGHKGIKVINGGVSGSTTNDGLSRLKWYLKKRPDLMLLALGANDGLRGLSVEQTTKNLSKIIDMAKKNNVKVLLAGMLMPPNYGKKYTEDFKNIFVQIKKKYHLKSMPFLLEGIAGKKEFNQKDGIHPNEAGHLFIAKKVYLFIKDEI